MRRDEDDDVDDGEEANRVRRGMTGWRNGELSDDWEGGGRKKRSGTLPTVWDRGEERRILAALQQGVAKWRPMVMDNHGSCGSSNQWKVKGARKAGQPDRDNRESEARVKKIIYGME